MTSKFSAHGKSEISVTGRIMTIQSRGPWNIEYFTVLHNNIIIAIKDNDLKEFAVLLIPYGEAIGVYGALEYHVNFLRQGNVNAIAINLANCDTPQSTESLCRIAYEAAGFEHEFFYEDEPALAWLKKQFD